MTANSPLFTIPGIELPTTVRLTMEDGNGPTHTFTRTPPEAKPDQADIERLRSGAWVIRRGGAFFRPHASGYTNHIEAAGLYTREEAEKYLTAEGVTIEPLETYRREALAGLQRAQKLVAALSPSSDAVAGVDR